MPGYLHFLMALMLFTLSSHSSAQQFNSFRFISEDAPLASGAVTSIELQASDDVSATLSFLDAAGLSTVYDIRFSVSRVISSELPVFLPPADFSNSLVPGLDLEGVQFLTGSLSDPNNDTATPPAHWFRMTLFNGIWSGSFRVADRVYSIDRLGGDPVIDVRNASESLSFQPSKRVKVSAVIDDDYVFNFPQAQNLGHINAMESLHVMDGLVADSLGISLNIEQLVYRSAAELTSAGAVPWLASNAEAFGLEDNVAVFFYQGGSDIQAFATDELVVQGEPLRYQFDSAFYLGQLFDLPEQESTLTSSDLESSTLVAGWNSVQREHLEDNPPESSLTQILSFDEPEIEVTPEMSIPIPDFILDAESEESSNGLGLQSDGDFSSSDSDQSAEAGGSSGGGALGLKEILILFLAGIVLIARPMRQSV